MKSTYLLSAFMVVIRGCIITRKDSERPIAKTFPDPLLVLRIIPKRRSADAFGALEPWRAHLIAAEEGIMRACLGVQGKQPSLGFAYVPSCIRCRDVDYEHGSVMSSARAMAR